MNLWERFTNYMRAVVRSYLDLHPEALDREHLFSLRSDEEQEYRSLLAGGYWQARSEYETHVWVHKAASVWAETIAPLRIGVASADGKLTFDHQVARLLANPSESMTASDLWRQWATDMALGGECGFEFVRSEGSGRIVEIHPRQPVDFSVRPDHQMARYGRVAAYVMFPDDQDQYTLTPAQFKHFKFYNPLNIWRGLAPLTAVRLGVSIDQLVQLDTRVFFDNNTRPDYALLVPQGLTSTERNEMERKLASKFGGVGQAHKPIVLEDGVQDIKTFSFPRKDSEWAEQRRFSRDEIGAIFGIPDEIMGYGRNTYENFDTAERVLWSLTIKNLVDFRDEQLTHFFHRQNMLADERRVQTDLSRVWALRRAAAQQMRDALGLFAMGVPFNTIDTHLGLGVGPVPGGDVGHPSSGGNLVGDQAIDNPGEKALRALKQGVDYDDYPKGVLNGHENGRR